MPGFWERFFGIAPAEQASVVKTAGPGRINWAEQIEQVKAADISAGQQSSEKLARESLERRQRAWEKVASGFATLDQLGVKELLTGIRDQVWQAGEIIQAPTNIEDIVEHNDVDYDQNPRSYLTGTVPLYAICVDGEPGKSSQLMRNGTRNTLVVSIKDSRLCVTGIGYGGETTNTISLEAKDLRQQLITALTNDCQIRQSDLPYSSFYKTLTKVNPQDFLAH